ncbi:unnamed protein product, partial [Hymenolepis diminuta]
MLSTYISIRFYGINYIRKCTTVFSGIDYSYLVFKVFYYKLIFPSPDRLQRNSCLNYLSRCPKTMW